MSGSNEQPLATLTVVSATTGLRILGFTATGVPRAVEPAAFGGGGGTGGDGPALSDAAPLALGASALAGTSLLASRADHVHARPTAAQIGAAATVHTHVIADVTNLQATLDAKAALTHTHIISDVSGLQTVLDSKAALAHSHPVTDITGLQAALDLKQSVQLKGVANGYASLGSDGRVPTAQLPDTSTGVSNVLNGTQWGQYPSWNMTTSKYDPTRLVPEHEKRTRAIERNSATTLSFLDYNKSILVLTGNAPLTLAAAETGSYPDVSFDILIYNDWTAQNTLTFGAGIEVNADPVGTGVGGAVKIGSKGLLAVSVVPAGTTRRVALARGKIE